MDWCVRGQHEQCRREYQAFVIEPNRKRGQPDYKVVYLDKWRYCDCTVRSCQCYKNAKERQCLPSS